MKLLKKFLKKFISEGIVSRKIAELEHGNAIIISIGIRIGTVTENINPKTFSKSWLRNSPWNREFYESCRRNVQKYFLKENLKKSNESIKLKKKSQALLTNVPKNILKEFRKALSKKLYSKLQFLGNYRTVSKRQCQSIQKKNARKICKGVSE